MAMNQDSTSRQNLDPIPPHDPQIEAAVLGAMQFDDRSSDLCFDQLEDEDFYVPAHRTVFLFFRTLHIDVLHNCPLLGAAWDKAYPGSMIDPTSFMELVRANPPVERFIRALKAKSADRKAIVEGQRLKESGEHGDGARALGLDRPDMCLTGHEQVIQEVEDEGAGRRKAIDWPKFPRLSVVKALLPGTVTVLCGQAGASKSLFLLECCWRWFACDIPCVVLELEKGVAFHLRRAWAQIAERSELTNDTFCNRHIDEVRERLETFKANLARLEAAHVIQATNDEDKIDVDYLLDWVELQCKDGRRVITIDPVTLMDSSSRPWDDHRKFVRDSGRLMTDYKASLIGCTHPRTIGVPMCPHMDNIQGGMAWRQFSDTVLWLEAHPTTSGTVEHEHTTDTANYNRTIHVLKARLGPGAGWRIAVEFTANNLWHHERGRITE